MSAAWPPLAYAQWQETCSGLHLRTQIAGKVRLAQTPWVNHGWQVPLYVTPLGLTTGSIPYGSRSFDIGFDFVRHDVRVRTSDGGERAVALRQQSIAAFYTDIMRALSELDVPVTIHGRPNEIPGAVPFAQDEAVRPYDSDAVERFHRALLQADRVLQQFRTRFLGKASPVHFFWGGFDLAVTRFSGRTAPLHPGGIPALPDVVTREAYSHEVSSAGFWPGGDGMDAAFYSYAYPEPDGFRDARIRPGAASYHPSLREYVLPYDAVRSAAKPDEMLLDFLQSTYDAAADAGHWDRSNLDCPDGRPRIPRAIGR